MPPVGPDEAVVMEILKVGWAVGNADTVVQGAASQQQIRMRLCVGVAPSSLPTTYANQVVCYMEDQYSDAITTSGGNDKRHVFPIWHDYTDGSGHGILVAAKQLHLAAATSGFAAATFFQASIIYRWKKVGLVEYLGMLASLTNA